jgi:Asp-tRNA(Asn)/Glu-tRNA(Gln) amidotransferase A subunit family amidase
MKEASIEADKQYKESNNRLLEDISVCVKDNIDTTDSVTTTGSPTLKENVFVINSQV